MKHVFNPIGVVRSPFKNQDDILRERWRRTDGFKDVRGEIEIFPDYAEGLGDIDGFSHIILLFVFDRAEQKKLKVSPPFADGEKGVFSTRSPHRPNAIGMTVLKLLGRENNVLHVSGLDVFDRTPVLDIKPYTPRDQKQNIKSGWLEQALSS